MKSFGTFSIFSDVNGTFICAEISQTSNDDFHIVKYMKDENSVLKRTIIDSIPLSERITEVEEELSFVSEKSILKTIYRDAKEILKEKFGLSNNEMSNLYYIKCETRLINQDIVDYNLFLNEKPDQKVDQNIYSPFESFI